MDAPEIDREPQDQAEVYDETHVDDDGVGDTDFEEMDPVLDVTRQRGDSAINAFDDEHEDPDSARGEDLEATADSLLGVVRDPSDHDGEANSADVAPDEIELVFTGLMRNQRGAQASAAHWEAKRLSDEDLNQLGYGPEREKLP